MSAKTNGLEGGRAIAPPAPGAAVPAPDCPVCGRTVVVASGRERCPAGCGWREAAPRFSLGRTVATPGALADLAAAGMAPAELLARHVRGDWGELDTEDRQANAHALANGERLLSAYTLATGARLWCITEWDRSATTLLRPEDY